MESKQGYNLLQTELPIPSLEPTTPIKQDLYQEAFLLHHTLTDNECKHYIQEGEKTGFCRLDWEIVDRQNDRIMFPSSGLAEFLWQRIEPSMKNIEVHVNYNPQPGETVDKQVMVLPARSIDLLGCASGKWVPHRLNSRFRLCKYLPGGHFGAHYDGCYVESEDERSLFTFMIYLNTEYTGGLTRFLSDDTVNVQSIINPSSSNDDKSVKLDDQQREVTKIVGPIKPGTAIIFAQDKFHDGSSVESGLKYIMRTDVVFRRVANGNTNVPVDPEQEARRLIRLAEDLERSGKPDAAVQYYKKAFSLSKTIADQYGC